MNRLLRWPVAVSIAVLCATPVAGESEAESEAIPLDRITVLASKSERPAREIAAPVTVIDAAEMERIMAEDIADLVRYEPGVNVPFQGQRFGLAGFNIRGLGGNRVQILTDGVRIPDAFAIGDFANAARNFIDVDTLKQAEILRGPASSLFGSSALGGVVAFATKDPADWLRATDSNVTARVRGGYYSADEGWVASGTLVGAGAGAGGHFSGLIHYVERRGHELDNRGNTGGAGDLRTEPDPHDYTNRNVLAKLLYGEGSASQWRLTIEGNRGESDTEVLSMMRTQDFSGQFGLPYVIETSRLEADDLARRNRVSLDHRWLPGAVVDRLEWRVYWQDSLTRQDTFEDRVTRIMDQASAVTRFRRARFEQEIGGGEMTGQKTFATGRVNHDLVAGVEIYRTRTKQSRDGLETDLTTGQSSNVVGPDNFPVRDFPNSEALEAGLYLEDRIRAGTRFTLIPGVRADHYRLNPKVDDLFAEDNPGIDPVKLRETSVSPRLGVLFEVANGVDLFAQYARGFRSPPFNDVNVGFTNFQFGYTAIPNPDLKPETSDGFEAGIKGAGYAGSFSFSVFENRYKDFIESFVSLGADPDTGLLVFQSQNLTKVRIRGAEFSGLVHLGQWLPGLSDWHLRTAAAWARGDDRSAGVPLNSIDPFTGVIGVQWRPEASPLEAELVASFAHRKTHLDPADSPFAPPGYAVLDFIAAWHINSQAVLRAGVYNITDRRYWLWPTVRGRSQDSAVLDRYTQPGRNFGVSLSWQF